MVIVKANQLLYVYRIGVARGCSGCTCTPMRRKNILGVICRENL